MGSPRLSGSLLAVVRALAATPVGALLWVSSAKELGIDTFRAVAPGDLGLIADLQVPLVGRRDHGWSSADLPLATPHRTTARTLHAAFAAGRLSPVDVTERWLNRHTHGPWGESLRTPMASVDAHGAREQAQASAERFRAGRPLGPLDGVPVPVKDEVHVAELPTLGGTRHKSAIQRTDAWVVSKLKAAGAVVAAKSHATEWGMNPCGTNAHHAFPRNVRSREHGAGGSSTGSAVAVGLGWTPMALGSDGGCSIRTPACLAGVQGIKPTWLRIGRTGDAWAGGTMGHLGPLGGTTQDLVDGLAAMAGVDPHDTTTSLAPDAHDAAPWQAALRRGVKGCRIGVIETEWADADPRIARLGEAALKALEADGAVIVRVEMPLAGIAQAAGALIIASETTAALHEDFLAHGRDYGDEMATIMQVMKRVPARDFLLASRVRTRLREQLAALYRERVDLLALPTAAGLAPKVAPDEQDVVNAAATANMSRFAFLGNLTGLPAGTVPTGLIHTLPAGIQFMGDAWDEASVFAVMAHAERQGWAVLEAPPDFLDLGAA